jgi:rod shape-determining protein MreC
VLALLVGVSLILLTAYFGESPSSPLHSVQRGIVEVLSPIQEGASKVLSPVRDVAGWFSDTFNARSQVKSLKNEVAQLRAKNAQPQQAEIENQQLRRDVNLDNSDSISSYQPVGADVYSRSPTLWYSTITVDKGRDDGVAVNDPVVGDGALVGKVTTVAATVSVVTLITDHTFSAAAEVQDTPGDSGVLSPQVGNPNVLLLQDLPKPNPSQPLPTVGQQVVTTGFKDGPLDSLYPAGIPIGTVGNTNQNNLQNNLYNNGQLQVTPDADLRHLTSVQILTRPHANTQRAQLP